MRSDICLQAGHAGRRKGATGTSGTFGAEKVWTLQTALAAAAELTARGWTVEVTDADSPVPDAHVFIALHQDGSSNKKARGPSVGYPGRSQASKQAAQVWKSAYAEFYPGPAFRGDNYTSGLANYYGYRKSSATVKLCCEHGFATNYKDAEFMWSEWGLLAVVYAVEATAASHLGAKDHGVSAPLTFMVPDLTTGEPVAAEEAGHPVTCGPGCKLHKAEQADATRRPETATAASSPAGSTQTAPAAQTPAPGPVGPSGGNPVPVQAAKVSDSAARSAWTAMQTAIPAFAGVELLDLHGVEAWHLVALTVCSAALSAVKNLIAGRAK